MATIKLKYRASSVKGKDGTLFFQIIHQRQVRQIYTGLRVSDAEWDAEEALVNLPSETSVERTKYLVSIKDSLKECQKKLLLIISGLDRKGSPYTAQDVVVAYNTPMTITGLVSFTRKLVEDLKKIGKKATVRRFEATLNSLLRYTDNSDVACVLP